MEFKIEKNILIYILLLIPFFKLYSIDMLLDMNIIRGLLYPLDRLLAISRWCITGYMLLEILFKHRKISMMTKYITFFVMVRCLSIMVNRDFKLNLIIGNITYIGFALLIDKMYIESEKSFLKANINFFGILSIASVLSNMLFPNGFFDSSSKAEAVYLLGSKNSGFYYYLPFVFFEILYSLQLKDKLPRFCFLTTLFLLTGGIITDSSNTVICILLISIYILCFHMIKKIHCLFRPKNVLVLIVVLAYIILFGKKLTIINSFLGLFGRDNTFTGRNYIWESYITMFINKPLWGGGYDAKIEMPSGLIANHAHNFFLDNLVKYGTFEFMALLAIIIKLVKSISRNKNKKILIFNSVVLFLILLHSLLDDLTIYTMILLFVTMEKSKENLSLDKVYIKQFVLNSVEKSSAVLE